MTIAGTLLQRLRKSQHPGARATLGSDSRIPASAAEQMEREDLNEEILATDFRHEPLSLDKSEIRLLYFDTVADEGDPIRCTIKVHAFDRHLPTYTAISYTWGEETNLTPILVNGCSFSIRNNLWTFLSCYTQSYRDIIPGPLWIDQISIDQDSILERNHQVQLMYQIYSQAERVVTWLGVEEAKSTSVIEWINELGGGKTWIEGKSLTYLLESNLAPMGITPRHVALFFDRTYWKRLWVAQEIILAQKWMILCGTTQLDEHALQQVVNYLYSGSTLSKYVAPAKWIRERVWRKSHLERQQVDVLHYLSHLECSDLRDKIYGLQALVHPSKQVKVDYNLPPGEVFWAAFSHLEFASKTAARSYASSIKRLGSDMRVTGDEQGYNGSTREIFQGFFPGKQPAEVFIQPVGVSEEKKEDISLPNSDS